MPLRRGAHSLACIESKTTLQVSSRVVVEKAKAGHFPIPKQKTIPHLYHLELERLRGEVVLEAEVDLAALFARLALLVVHVHQGDAAVVPEGQLK